MRIVGGSLKGRQVELKAASARPTSEKVREALFSILYDRIGDAACLDLFAGSGCIGCGRCFYSCPEPGAITIVEEVEE